LGASLLPSRFLGLAVVYSADEGFENPDESFDSIWELLTGIEQIDREVDNENLHLIGENNATRPATYGSGSRRRKQLWRRRIQR
jgi:hypothetical protein